MNINGIEISRSRIIILSLVMLGLVIAIGFAVMYWGDADGDGNNSDSFFGILFNDEKMPADSDPLRGGVIIGEDGGGEGEEMTLYLISQDPVIGASLSSDGTHVRYFKQAGGNLFET